MIERGRIVVIDDELSLLDLVRRYLERDGYTVSVSASGADGFEAAARADAQLAHPRPNAAGYAGGGAVPSPSQAIQRAHPDADSQGAM